MRGGEECHVTLVKTLVASRRVATRRFRVRRGRIAGFNAIISAIRRYRITSAQLIPLPSPRSAWLRELFTPATSFTKTNAGPRDVSPRRHAERACTIIADRARDRTQPRDHRWPSSSESSGTPSHAYAWREILTCHARAHRDLDSVPTALLVTHLSRFIHTAGCPCSSKPRNFLFFHTLSLAATRRRRRGATDQSDAGR